MLKLLRSGGASTFEKAFPRKPTVEKDSLADNVSNCTATGKKMISPAARLARQFQSPREAYDVVRRRGQRTAPTLCAVGLSSFYPA